MAKLDYKQFEDYVFSLVHATPYYFYEGLASIFCLGLVVFIAWKGFKTGFRYAGALLLIEYVFLIFCSTVIFRTAGATRRYDFHPFWSYDRPELLIENIMNAIAFISVGVLLGCAFKQMTWWKVLLIGCSISITVEALQFWFMKGFSEVDYVMHNTVGCLIGWFMVKGSRLEDEMLADVRRLMSEGRCLQQEQIHRMTDQELAIWYNDYVIYPDKVRLNCYYYRHYSFVKDIQMILCTVLGKKMEYNRELI